jgi:hypothetical protein
VAAPGARHPIDHQHPVEPQIDYHRKRGLIEEINRTLQHVDDDVAAHAGVATPAGVPAGPIEIPQ